MIDNAIPGASMTDNVPTSTITTHAANRLVSLDVYRGMVMFLMLAEVLHLSSLSEIFPGEGWFGRFCSWLAYHTSHVDWVGCSLHDMIQPSFTFLVGVSLAYSIVSRKNQGQSSGRMLWHALSRSWILILLGIFLRSLGKSATNFTFDDTLTQIGLGYWILYLLSPLSLRGLSIAVVCVLVGYWMAFVAYPAPIDFPYEQYGVPQDWPEHWQTGLAMHFNKNSNLAWAFDTWWMNLFPRAKPFEFSGGGYSTLSFIPTLGTMILGLISGKLMLHPWPWARKFRWHVVIGVGLLLSAYAIHISGVCPIVKRIWTPSWTMWSGGVCFLWLAGLSLICDRWRLTTWSFPLLVVGANSIVAYVMSWTIESSTKAALERHFGSWLDQFSTAIGRWAGLASDPHTAFQPMVYGTLVLVVFWLMLWWLYRKKIFVRI